MNRNIDGDNNSNNNIDIINSTFPTNKLEEKRYDTKESMSPIDFEKENQKEKKKEIPFWVENPNILFQSEYLLEFFPIDEMTYEQKMNAISRLITILTIIGFILSYIRWDLFSILYAEKRGGSKRRRVFSKQSRHGFFGTK